MDPVNSATIETIVNRNADLDELKNLPGINVWGQRQDELEAQALKELEIFAKEDGELSDNNKDDEESPSAKHVSSSNVTLDVNTYIKRQEELRKQQEHKRSLQISEKSRRAAEKISKKHSKRKSVSLNEVDCKKIRKEIEARNPNTEDSGSEYCPSNGNSSDSDTTADCNTKVMMRQKHKISCEKKIIDDGSLKQYNARLDEYYRRLEKEINILQIDQEDIQISSGFKTNVKIWGNLYGYQQEGVEWLWALHQKSTGGLLGDEMGLGKTVEVITFLFSLNYSQVVSRYCRYTGLGAALIVCPTTVLHQWVQHFHEWAPEFRVAVLHQSGSYLGNRTQLIKDIFKAKGILITSYAGILKHKGSLVELDWHYLILDEGHKIRNPGAKITMAVKEFRTPHRILLTGSPMQNNLQELWSLFDFTNTGMLGLLSVFMDHFATPIMQGGYYNSTPMQEATALSMATALKNLITPYMLRRTKSEVRKDISLPYKTEQVLFCSLTDEQRDLYKGYLMSEHVSMILGRGGKNWHSENYMRANVLRSITTLRKICNHPDLYLEEVEENFSETDVPVEDRYGYYKRSGKMVVVSALLKIWKRQRHRMLLFTQGRAMISIFEIFLEQQGYKYLKMDGTTSISSRQNIINTFNQDDSYDVFLLTTKVGGLGVNLTGANRVIIYDPDWNPATDTQARERAWRIGQQKQVTIYRLLSAGTIEEKMYQRQVWKQLLSNKVLLDPRTQKFFKTSDLFDLFALQEDTSSETANIFQNSRVSFQEKIKEKKSDRKKKKVTSDESSTISFSKDKLEQMKILAHKIAKNISSSASNDNNKDERKSAYELELEAEKEGKAQERKYMKTLTPHELIVYNKKKLIKKDETTNKIDNLDTSVSFTEALTISEKTANIYHDMKEEKLKLETALNKYTSLTNAFHHGTNECKTEESHLNEVLVPTAASLEQTGDKNETERTQRKKKKTKSKDGIITDNSGEVDGEKIDGLLKLEIKKKHQREKEKSKSESQDQYVLEKLFSKKGVHTALQHDTIVQSGQKEQVNRFRLYEEAESKTNLALQALKKSRIKKWRW